MAIVWDPNTGRYIRVGDTTEQEIRAAANKRAQAQADMILEKRRQADIAANAASMGVETKAMAEARAKTPAIVDTYNAKVAKQTAKEAAAAKKAAEERIFGRVAGTTAAKQYTNVAQSQYEKTLQSIKDLYAPQNEVINAREQERLKMLADAITQAGGQIGSAEQDFLKYLPTSTAYQNVPLLNLPQEQNPLLAALQQQGAGTGSVEAQRALDAALSQQLSSLSSRAAEQTGASEQAYLDAIRRAGVGAAAAGRQYLAMQQPALEAQYRSQFDTARADLAAKQAQDEAAAQTALNKALLEAAKTQMETTQKYGPSPQILAAVKAQDAAAKNAKNKKAAQGMASTIVGR